MPPGDGDCELLLARRQSLSTAVACGECTVSPSGLGTLISESGTGSHWHCPWQPEWQARALPALQLHGLVPVAPGPGRRRRQPASASESEYDSELSSTGCQARLAGLRVPAPAACIAPVFAWHWNAGRASVRSLQGLSAASLDRRGRHQFVHLPYN